MQRMLSCGKQTVINVNNLKSKSTVIKCYGKVTASAFLQKTVKVSERSHVIRELKEVRKQECSRQREE